jgi:hypothetical protein
MVRSSDSTDVLFSSTDSALGIKYRPIDQTLSQSVGIYLDHWC